MNECLTCRYWQRNKDKLIGTCLQLDELRYKWIERNAPNVEVDE